MEEASVRGDSRKERAEMEGRRRKVNSSNNTMFDGRPASFGNGF